MTLRKLERIRGWGISASIVRKDSRKEPLLKFRTEKIKRESFKLEESLKG